MTFLWCHWNPKWHHLNFSTYSSFARRLMTLMIEWHEPLQSHVFIFIFQLSKWIFISVFAFIKAICLLFSFTALVVVVIGFWSLTVCTGNKIFLCKISNVFIIYSIFRLHSKTGWLSSWLKTWYCLSSINLWFYVAQMVPLHILGLNHLVSNSYTSSFVIILLLSFRFLFIFFLSFLVSPL